MDRGGAFPGRSGRGGSGGERSTRSQLSGQRAHFGRGGCPAGLRALRAGFFQSHAAGPGIHRQGALSGVPGERHAKRQGASYVPACRRDLRRREEPEFTSEMLRRDWENNRFVKEFFTRNTPGQKRARSPLLVISGEVDPAIPADMSEKTVARMCKQGDRILFLKYPGLDASGAMGASVADQISWIKARFAGYVAPGNCP